MKRSTILIGLGSLNLIHGILHILQFVQSVLLVSSSLKEDNHTGLDAVLHRPILSIISKLLFQPPKYEESFKSIF